MFSAHPDCFFQAPTIFCLYTDGNNCMFRSLMPLKNPEKFLCNMTKSPTGVPSDLNDANKLLEKLFCVKYL